MPLGAGQGESSASEEDEKKDKGADVQPVVSPSWDLLAYAVAAAQKSPAAQSAVAHMKRSKATTSSACVRGTHQNHLPQDSKRTSCVLHLPVPMKGLPPYLVSSV